jgi:hypothetical protein
VGERLDVEGGVAGIRPDVATPLPNKADAAWEELRQLRIRARDLGIEVDEAWPIQRLVEEIGARRG